MLQPIVPLSNAKKGLYIAPELADGVIDYQNPQLFDLEHMSKRERSLINDYLPTCYNKDVQNEIWGYVSYMVKDCHMHPRTISRRIYDLILIATIIDEQYPNASSILDISKDEMIACCKQQKIQLGFASEPTVFLSTHVDAAGNAIREVKNPSYYTTCNALWSFLVNIYDERPEYEKDTWDVRKLGIPVNIAVHKPIYEVSFSKIKQEWFKALAKDFVFFILPIRAMGTITQYMVVFRHLSSFLDSKYPEMTSFQAFDRVVAEGFLRYLGKRGYSANWFNTCISCIRTFFQMELMRGKDVPINDVFIDTDYQKKVIGEPEFFTDFELRQINAHLDDVPPQIARMTIVMEECGLRLSDLCSLTIHINGRPCLVETSNGDYTLTYYMPKVKRNVSIPISIVAALTIKSAIEESQRDVGQDAKYVFSKTADRPFSTDNYRRAMQAMAAKNELVTDDGAFLKIRGHTFRGTVATDLVNAGLQITLVKDLLGQKTLGVLKHYVKIHNETMHSYLQPLLDEDNKLIDSIGKPLQEMPGMTKLPLLEEATIALPNGSCAHEGCDCDDVFRCFDCGLFRPQKTDLPVFEAQLRRAKRNAELARSQGFVRHAERNEDLAERIQMIIDKIKEEM